VRRPAAALFPDVNLLKYVVTEVVFDCYLFRYCLLQGSVATHLRCDAIFSGSVITNLLLIVRVQTV